MDQQGQAQGAQGQGQGQDQNQVAQLFQNVGQGLVLLAKYVQQAAPQAMDAMKQLVSQYEQIVQAVSGARQGQGQEPAQAQQQSMPGQMETTGR